MQLGNDIIDLKIDSEIRDRFVDRILHPEERARYPGIENDDLLIWSLWAAKESAYKAYRQANMRYFLPNRWNVDLEASRVQFETQSWDLALHRSEDAIWATSMSASTLAASGYKIVSEMRSGTSELSPKEQNELGRAILQDLLKEHGLEAVLQKDEHQIPRLHFKDQLLPFSMSHHGRHVFVCLGVPLHS